MEATLDAGDISPRAIRRVMTTMAKLEFSIPKIANRASKPPSARRGVGPRR